MITNNFKQLETIFKQDGFETKILPAEEDPESDGGEILALMMANQEATWQWHLELMFLPQMDKPSILQVFALLPLQPTPEHYGDLARFVLKLNNYLPLTGFELSEKDGWVFFRYMLACGPEGVDSTLLLDTIWSVAFQIDRYGPLLYGITAGQQTLEQAVKALEESLRSND